MNAMTKAHEIRRAAAVKFDCEVSEIHFGECLRMANNNEEIEMEKEITVLEAVKAGLVKREDGSAMPLVWAEMNNNSDQVIPAFPGDKMTGGGETYTVSRVYFSDEGRRVFYQFTERPELVLSLDQLLQIGAVKA